MMPLPLRIKMCGLTREADVAAAVRQGVDALGFILAESPRRVSLERVRQLTVGLPPFTTVIGVVVNPTDGELRELVASRLFDGVQFSGDEPPELLRDFPLRTIKAFGIRDAADVEAALRYEGADVMLFDAGSPGARGGTGRPFDWGLLRRRPRGPFLLAGGLGPENVAEAVRAVRPWGVDLNSRVERSPGEKDEGLIRRAVEAARRAGSEVASEEEGSGGRG